jgi:hypothetical protein
MLDIAPKAGSRETLPGRLGLFCRVVSYKLFPPLHGHRGRGSINPEPALVTAQEFGKLRLRKFSLILPLAHSFNDSRFFQIFI